MSKWIDADKLHEAMQWAIEHDMYDKPFDYIAEVLDAPSIDIVRCKECKLADKCSQNVAMQDTYQMYEKIDFCSHGERRE